MTSKFKCFSPFGVLLTAAIVAVSLASQSGWRTQRYPSGFQVSLPPGWAAEGSASGRILIHDGDHKVFAILQPFSSNEGVASSEIGHFLKHAGSLLPNAQILRKEQISTEPDEEVARISFTARGGTGQANVLSILSGDSGMLYAIAAPSRVFSASRPILLKVLRSVSYFDPSTAGSARTEGSLSPLSFEPWSDPNEGSFTTEVPKGWHVYGGAYRFAPVDVRRQVALVSPGSQVHIQFGEARFSAFVTEGPSSQIRGLQEDQSYQANGVTYTVYHYMDGEQFSREYTLIKLKKDHPDLVITETKERTDIEAMMNQGSGQGPETRASAGETDFTYSEQGRTMNGKCMGSTVQFGQQRPGMMWLAYPSSITCPKDKMPIAEKVWMRVIAKTADNPSWARRQSQISQEFGEMVKRNFEASMQQMQKDYNKAISRLNENFRGMDNVINGTEDVRDPSTGQTYSVEAGHSFYKRENGKIVGADSPSFSGLEKY